MPEIGAGYDIERYDDGSVAARWARALGGARAGFSFAVLPALRFEPAVYGHVGYARWISGSGANGLANDVGLALDLRILKLFTVGAHLGYDV